MHNPEFVLENEKHIVFLSFKIQKDRLILARRLDVEIVNKKRKKRTCQIVNFVVPADDRENIKENENRDKYLDLTRELKITMEREDNGDTNCNRFARNNLQRVGKESRRLKEQVRNHPDHSIVKIARILRRVIETLEDLLSLKLQ